MELKRTLNVTIITDGGEFCSSKCKYHTRGYCNLFKEKLIGIYHGFFAKLVWGKKSIVSRCNTCRTIFNTRQEG